MNHSEAINEIAAALVKVQAEISPLPKDETARVETRDGRSFTYSYAALDTVMPEALKVLSKNGIALIQMVGGDDSGRTTLTTMLAHTSGQWFADTQPLILVKEDPQGQGSAITYARRYGLMAAIGLVAEDDDDGNAASKPPAKRQQPRPSQQPPAPAPFPPREPSGQARMPDDRPMSQGQRGMMFALLKGAQMKHEVVEEYLKKSVENFTMDDAREAIDWIKRQSVAAQP